MIADHSFEETHCDVCGCLNPDGTKFTCPECMQDIEDQKIKQEVIEELKEGEENVW